MATLDTSNFHRDADRDLLLPLPSAHAVNEQCKGGYRGVEESCDYSRKIYGKMTPRSAARGMW